MVMCIKPSSHTFFSHERNYAVEIGGERNFTSFIWGGDKTKYPASSVKKNVRHPKRLCACVILLCLLELMPERDGGIVTVIRFSIRRGEFLSLVFLAPFFSAPYFATILNHYMTLAAGRVWNRGARIIHSGTIIPFPCPLFLISKNSENINTIS
jgi:hypothetical protein